MILFARDWAKYPTAKPHMTTKNRSWVDICRIYKSMGIKNHAFPLALVNQSLADLDPFDPNLTAFQMAAIRTECKINPWYFFREVFRVPPNASKHSLPYEANRGSVGAIWTFFNAIDFILLQTRQTGKSLTADSIATVLKDVLLDNSTIQLITKDNNLRVNNVKRLKEMREYLPEYISMISPKDADNKSNLTNLFLGNEYKTSVAQNSKEAANKVARGMTSPVNFIDEPPFCKFIHITLPAMLSSSIAARDEAKLYGYPNCNMFTTTAGERGNEEGALIYEMMTGGLYFNEKKLFDLRDNAEAKRIVTTNAPGKKKMIHMQFSHRQLGYTDEWLQQKMEENMSFGDDADKDYFLKWGMSGAKSPILPKIADRISESVREPDHIEITKDNYIVNWYIPQNQIDFYMANNSTIAGMDTSDAVDRDALTFVMLDTETLAVIATVIVNETNLSRYASFIAGLLVKYTRLTIVPERKSSGMALIDSIIVLLLRNNIDPFRRIYSLVVDDEMYNTDPDLYTIRSGHRPKSIDFYDRYKRHFGYNTAGSGVHSRGNLYNLTLQQAVRYNCNSIHDNTLSTELNGLVSKNGRIDHGANKHDDTVIAYLLAMWTLMHSKNLDFYGINNPMSRVKEFNPNASNVVKTEREIVKDAKSQYFHGLIDDLLETLKLTSNEMAIFSIEQRIKSMSRKYPREGITQENMNNLIKEAKAHRRVAKTT